jgi:hypothetical protein
MTAYLDADGGIWCKFEPVLALWLQFPFSILFVTLWTAG